MKKYTWDEIYTAAEGCGCGESGLRAKDNARENGAVLRWSAGKQTLKKQSVRRTKWNITATNTVSYLTRTII